MDRRRLVRVPASSANLGPGVRRARRRARAAPRGGGRGDRAASRSRPTWRSRATAATSSCAPSSGCTRPDDFTFRIRSEIPLSGGLGSSAAAIVAGLLAADHLFELDADVLALAAELEGHPDNVAAARPRRLRGLRRRRGHALRPADRAGGPARRPARGGPHRGGARGAAGRGADGRRGPQRRARRAADARARARRLGPRRPRARRPPAPAAPRAPLPALGRARARRATRSGALGATISGAGPTVLVWTPLRADGGGRRAAARARASGWADVLRVPFESQGADVVDV